MPPRPASFTPPAQSLPDQHTLPIDAVLSELCQTLSVTPNALLHAPPGAGKTTRVPPALLTTPWLAGQRILMLEPRRLAARSAAAFMARTLGEQPGQTVGYRIRHETRVGSATRIEVITEGVLTRLLQADPELSGYGIVIFDEFHERSMHADLGLALCREAQNALRPDLRLLVMSATLDCAPVAALLDDCPLLSCEGRSFPVSVRHAPPPRETRTGQPAPSVSSIGPLSAARLAHVAATVRHALRTEQGDILVFLPGAGEIRRTAEMLCGSPEKSGSIAPSDAAPLPQNVVVRPLYGDLSPQEQDAAIAPAPDGTRKVVLATSIAETSLTIEGIKVVVDSGFTRLPRFHPGSGMTRLVTEQISLASAIQRQGRAGRLSPGVCWRLWDQADEHSMRAFTPPEIRDADLAPLVLELAAWGVTGYSAACALPWLTPPPSGNFAQAVTLLQEIGALNAAQRITPHGSALLSLPLHPRLAHMVLTTMDESPELTATACAVAALLAERPPREVDLRSAVARLASPAQTASRAVSAAFDHIQRVLRNIAPAGFPSHGSSVRADDAGECLALAYPDRIAQQRGNGLFRLANGRSAVLPPEAPLAHDPFLAVAELDGNAARARIWTAAPISREVLENRFARQCVEHAHIAWDSRSEAVSARKQTRLGALILADAPLANDTEATREAVRTAILDGIRSLGLHCLPWDAEARTLCARVNFLRGLAPQADAGCWPDMHDPALLDSLEMWLAPFLSGVTRRSQFSTVDLLSALRTRLDWSLLRRLDAEAPTHVTVPSGSHIRLDYADGTAPILPVKLQEMFGASQTPTIASGRHPLTVHLLSPAGRPLQVTCDLPSFWKNGYPAVRAEMRGRYPKHPWPEDPTTALPTRHTTRRLRGK